MPRLSTRWIVAGLAVALAAALLPTTATAQGGAALTDPQLTAYLAAQPAGTAVPAVVTYESHPGAAELARLEGVGVTKGFLLQELPMVIADLDAAQVAAVAAQPGVLSVWGNEVMSIYTDESREFVRSPQMMADTQVTAQNTLRPGFPFTGQGVGVGHIDTGVDGTHGDLEYGYKTVQNVNQPLANGVVSDGGLVLGVGISVSDLINGTGFVPPIYIENQPSTELESGHGTHGAGVIAGTGVRSGDRYGGVAPGAKLIGISTGDDKGLPLVAILGAFNYMLVRQSDYNIRVLNNSWGTRLSAAAVSPANPINVATRIAHDRNMVVVFAAGNAGDTPTSINPYSTMPWVISVAAGEKRGLGTPASFSSRGVNDGTGTDVAGQPANPAAPPNLRPDVSAPGVEIISTKPHTASAPIMTASSILLGGPQKIPPAFQAEYYMSNGTSFAAPHVSGVVALMLEADPTLTPDEVVTILRATAAPMPFPERVVGAGTVDAWNAVRVALGLSTVPSRNLFPGPGGPEIVDLAGDQIGTDAQDILEGDFSYDSGAGQLVYRLEVTDLALATANDKWLMESSFAGLRIFVSAGITETLAEEFEYGTITLQNNINTQTTLGDADSGSFDGNTITIRVAVAKINAATGFNVVGTTSTATAARSQILFGTSVTGGLLLNSDNASGADFVVE